MTLECAQEPKSSGTKCDEGGYAPSHIIGRNEMMPIATAVKIHIHFIGVFVENPQYVVKIEEVTKDAIHHGTETEKDERNPLAAHQKPEADKWNEHKSFGANEW